MKSFYDLDVILNNCIKMKNKNKSVTDNTKKSEIKIVSTRYPGVEDALIIPSYPVYKEKPFNSIKEKR